MSDGTDVPAPGFEHGGVTPRRRRWRSMRGAPRDVGDSDLVRMVVGTHTGGPEATEWYSDGSYRVSRCGLFGELVFMQTVAPVTVPGGMTAMLPVSKLAPSTTAGDAVAALYPAAHDPVWASRWNEVGPRLQSLAAPPTTGVEIPLQAQQASSSAAGERDPSCRRRSFRRLPYKWETRGFSYVIDTASLPQGRLTKARIRDGYDSWNKTRDACGVRDVNNFTMSFARDAQPGERALDQNGHQVDGVNVVDFGFVSGGGPPDASAMCDAAVACTYIDPRQPNRDAILEVDVRLNARYLFYSRRTDPRTRRERRIDVSKCRAALDPPDAPECYDVFGVVAHEAGHSLGLAHSPDPTQTMADEFPADSSYDTRKLRTLGRGDIAGFRTLYPAQ